LLAATAQNSKWPEKFIYKIVPVEVTAPHSKSEQKPVAWMDEYGDVLSANVVDGNGLRNIPLYTTPPKREWVGLTEEEITEIRLKSFDSIATNHEVYEAIEAKLREKNNG
jgi:hypothetical protein